VIPPQFDNALIFQEGLAGVRIGKKYGFIDKAGKIIIPAQYDTCEIFIDGIASVTKGIFSGYINKSGDFIWSNEFSLR
jgi:hypothetical protein